MSKSIQKNHKESTEERPPVVVVMGHVDHGKSTLLDYIRKSNVVAGEAGGITQHTSAYEVTHITGDGEKKNITFLDTPGHSAFSLMRDKGASAADIAILVVAADDGVKKQTLEALGSIKKSGIPFVVALNKTDRPQANVEKVKQELAENEVFLEGYGGDISFVEISAKTGGGVSDLLDLVLLTAEMEGYEAVREKSAEGIIIESHKDARKGISATLIIKDGTMRQGMYIVVEDILAPIRRIEDFNEEQVKELSFSSPAIITGFPSLPQSGDHFFTCDTKKEAEQILKTKKVETPKSDKKIPEKRGRADTGEAVEKKHIVVPIVIKADTEGTLSAVAGEVGKIGNEQVEPLILSKEVGTISEADVHYATAQNEVVIVGFNVGIEKAALRQKDQHDITMKTFTIIYELVEWLEKILEERRPRIKEEETTGKAKLIRMFSAKKNQQVVGGKVIEGTIKSGDKLKILRRDFEIGRGEIIELQHNKVKVKEVESGSEFGAQIATKQEAAPNDVIEAYKIVEK